MQSEMKFITFYGKLSIEIVIFSNFRTHSEYAELLNIELSDIIGAGFVSFTNETPQCYGESKSLDKRSSDFDTSILLEAIGWDR